MSLQRVRHNWAPHCSEDRFKKHLNCVLLVCKVEEAYKGKTHKIHKLSRIITRAGKKGRRSLDKGSVIVVVTRVRPWDLKAAGGSCQQMFWEQLVVSLSLTQFGKSRFSERQECAWNHIHNGHLASFLMPEPQWLHFYFLNAFFPFIVKAGVQCMFDGPENKLFSEHKAPVTSHVSQNDLFHLSMWKVLPPKSDVT